MIGYTGPCFARQHELVQVEGNEGVKRSMDDIPHEPMLEAYVLAGQRFSVGKLRGDIAFYRARVCKHCLALVYFRDPSTEGGYQEPTP